MNDSQVFSGFQPRQDLSYDELVEKYKGAGASGKDNPLDQWYKENVRWVATFFNKKSRPIADETLADPWLVMGEAERAYQNMLYIQGDQLNRDIGALGMVQSAGYTSAPWQAGKETWRFTNYIANNYLKVLRSSKAVVKSYDHKAQTKLNKKIALAMLKYDQAPFFEELAKEFGVKFEPTDGKQMYSKEQAEKYFFQTPQSQAEILGTEIIRALQKRNSYDSMGFKALMHLLGGGRSMVDVIKVGGWTRWDLIPPWSQICQSLDDDDFGQNDVCRGWVRPFTPNHILSRWGKQLTKKYGAEIVDKIATGSGEFISTNQVRFNGWSFEWYTLDKTRVKTYSVCKVYWKSLVDSRTLPDRDDPNNKVFYLSKASKKKGEMVEIWRTATLIGNQWIVDEEICDEIRNPLDPTQLFCPLFYFQPNTYMGYNKSIVDQIRQTQNDLSMLDYKFREMVGFDMGVVLKLRGGKFMNVETPYDAIEELKKTRILIETESGDIDNPLDNKEAIERIDFSTAKIAMDYLTLWKAKEQMMKDILNISDIALGTQKGYVGFDTQQATMDASASSMQYIFFGQGKMMAAVMQYSLELTKVMVQRGETGAAESIVGDRGIYFLKELKKNLFETLLVRVDFEDFIDEKQRASLEAKFDMLLQAGGADLTDVVELQSMQTWSEMKDYARWKTAKLKADAEGQQLFDKLMGVVNSAQQQQSMEQMNEAQIMATQQNTDKKIQADMLGKVLNYDAKVQGNEAKQQPMPA
jgi:hypothetical protein